MFFKISALWLFVVCGCLATRVSAQESRPQTKSSYTIGKEVELRLIGQQFGKYAIVPIYEGTITKVENGSITMSNVSESTRVYSPISWLEPIPQISKYFRAVSESSQRLTDDVQIDENDVFQPKSPSND